MAAAEIEVLNPTGLHARPAAAFVKAAQRFKSRIILENLSIGRAPGEGKSILGVLACGVQKGHRVRISAVGDDEALAVKTLVGLIESGLGESVEA